jgi:hypothetical protein
MNQEIWGEKEAVAYFKNSVTITLRNSGLAEQTFIMITNFYCVFNLVLSEYRNLNSVNRTPMNMDPDTKERQIIIFHIL